MYFLLTPRNAAPVHGWLAQLCASGMQSPFQCRALKKFFRRCDEKEIRDDEKYWKSVQKKINETLQKSYARHLRIK
jgi:hypothetical protein